MQVDQEETVKRPEIVLGLVGALGTDLRRVEEELERALLSVGYGHRNVDVSGQLSVVCDELELEGIEEGPTPIDALMNRGDALREHFDHGAAAAAFAISSISKARHEELGGAEENGAERESVATIVRQLKHPEEVRLLRSVYGPRFLLIGAWSTKGERQAATADRLRELAPTHEPSWYEEQVPRLIRRDEKDGARPLGQRVRDTFELADAFISLQAGHPISADVSRIVRLLFGDFFETPTKDEQAMFQAFGARLRSSAGGRQVGAVAIDDDGELLASGTNEVPKADGGQYWTGDEPDHRDFQSGADSNDREKIRVVRDIFQRLKKKPGDWLADSKKDLESVELASRALAPGGPLSRSRVADLLEFGRVLHAEMALICTAARRGTALRGSTLYVTTYPCHGCARLIIGAGVSKVVYVDPYPKSLAMQMYGTEVYEDVASDSKIGFEPFAGIAPRLFPRVFTISGKDRERDPLTGSYIPWDPTQAQPRLEETEVLRYPIQDLEDAVTRRFLTGDLDDGESASE